MNNKTISYLASVNQVLPSLVTQQIIVLDSNYLTTVLKSLEEDLDLDLNEHDILSFIFNAFRYKHNALEELDYGLLELYDATKPNYQLLQNNTENVLKVIKEVGVFLYNQLLSYNCYRKNNLVYYPKLDLFNQKLLPYQISLSPLILIPINLKDI